MKNFLFVLPLAISLSIFSACQKQQSDADRQAEVDREVQRRLDAEHEAQQKEDLARREGEITAREQALADSQKTASATPAEERAPERSEERGASRHETRESSGGSYETFYTKLQPYGDWIQTSDYGYVFQPREAEQSSNWRPYTDGHWVYSDVGWAWVSEEPFGWAAYHYGRWARLRDVGWVWVPGDEWAPAWVSWRKSDNYVGWAPLPPEARFDRRTGIHNWADNYYDIGPENYSFVETRSFGAPRVERAVIPAQQNLTIVNQTTNVTNITYSNTTVVNQGPNYEEIRTRTAEPPPRLRLERELNVNINLGEPRAVVRGDVLSIPAPIIARAQPVDRPPTIKRTIANVTVERGWQGIRDQKAAQEARAKMKSEATPPPNAPPKTFVRPVPAPGSTGAASTVSASPNGSPSATAVPESAATTTATPFRRVTATPAPTASAAATSSPIPSSTPGPTARARATATAAPSASATAMPAASASATPSPHPIRPRATITPGSSLTAPVGPSPAASASPAGAGQTATPINVRGPDGKLRSVRKMMEERGITPQPLPRHTASVSESTASPQPTRTAPPAAAASATPSATTTPTTEKSKRFESQALKAEPRRFVPMQSPSPGSSAASSATPAGATTTPPLTRREKKEMKQDEKAERKRERRQGVESAETASPSPSASASE